MTNTLYLLLTNPQYLEKFGVECKQNREEEKATLMSDHTDSERVISYQQDSSIKYLRACVDEVFVSYTQQALAFKV